MMNNLKQYVQTTFEDDLKDKHQVDGLMYVFFPLYERLLYLFWVAHRDIRGETFNRDD